MVPVCILVAWLPYDLPKANGFRGKKSDSKLCLPQATVKMHVKKGNLKLRSAMTLVVFPMGNNCKGGL